MTENGSCHHANGGSLAFCYNSSKSISRKECEEECTSTSSCIGYQYGLPLIRDRDFRDIKRDIGEIESTFVGYRSSRCYLIPNSRKCPKDYHHYQMNDENPSIAKTTSDIIPMPCRGHTYCYQCYAKSVVESKYLTNNLTEDVENLHSINLNTGKFLLIKKKFSVESCNRFDKEIWCRIINVDRHCSDKIIRETCPGSCKVCKGNCPELYHF